MTIRLAPVILGIVVVLNPAASVRAERYQAVEGKTPEVTVESARRLLASIDDTHVVGLRDRAVVGVLIYTAARVGAVATDRSPFAWLRFEADPDYGERASLRLTLWPTGWERVLALGDTGPHKS